MKTIGINKLDTLYPKRLGQAQKLNLTPAIYNTNQSTRLVLPQYAGAYLVFNRVRFSKQSESTAPKLERVAMGRPRIARPSLPLPTV